MRAGLLVVLVVLRASIACSQELRFVYPVPAPTDFAQSNLVYKQSGQTGLSLDFFFPPAPLRKAIAGLRNFQRFWWRVHADFGQSSRLGEGCDCTWVRSDHGRDYGRPRRRRL